MTTFARSARTALAALALTAVLGAPAMAQDQADLIMLIEEPLTFVFIPKVIHPWYDVVVQGAQYAVEELKKEGIEVEVIWDQPPSPTWPTRTSASRPTSARRPTVSRWPASTKRPTFSSSRKPRRQG